MPGLFGLALCKPGDDVAAALAPMAHRMRHFPWYKESRYVDAQAGVALGRLSLGFVNGARQPVTGNDSSLLAFLEGELFNYVDERQTLERAGHRFTSDSHAELLLRGFEQEGNRFFRRLNGTFVAAIWDASKRRLVLVSDRFGMKPLYYAHLPGRFVFASEIKSLLAHPELPRTSNLRGIAQFFTFGQLLRDDTLLEDVKVLPAAGCLTYDAGQDRVELERYWSLAELQPDENPNVPHLLDRIDDALTRSVQQRAQNTESLGLSLSGGLDARTILAALPDDCPVTTITMGMKGSMDHRGSRELARLAGCAHHQYVLDTKFLGNFEQHLRRMVHLTDGHYLSQCIVMPTLPFYRELGIEVLLRGHAGELLHLDKAYSFSVDRGVISCGTADELEAWLLQRLRMHMSRSITDSLFAKPIAGNLEPLARASLRECLRESESINPQVQRISHLFINQRLRRETALSMVKFGSQVETRLPYLDNDLINLLMVTPAHVKLGDRIQRHVLKRLKPSFLRVPNSNTGARIGAGWLTRTIRKAQIKVYAKLGAPGYQPYERLGLWLRRELRDLVERILLSDRCLDRGVFSSQTVHAVVQGHFEQNVNHTYLLMVMMIFELGQQALMDGEDFASSARDIAHSATVGA